MQHYQIHMQCGICKRAIIADIFSVGVEHQNIAALTCLECAQTAGGYIMPEGHTEEVKITSKPSLEF